MKKIKTKLVALFTLTITPLSAVIYGKTQTQNNNSKTVNADNVGQLGTLPPDELPMPYPEFPLSGQNFASWHFQKVGGQMLVIAKFYLSAAIVQFYYSDCYRDYVGYLRGYYHGESTLTKLLFDDDRSFKDYYPEKGEAYNLYKNQRQNYLYRRSFQYYTQANYDDWWPAFGDSYIHHTGFSIQTTTTWNDGYIQYGRDWKFESPSLSPGDTAYNGENSVDGDLAELGSELNININGPYAQIINDFFSKGSARQFWNWFSGENGLKPPDSFPLAKQIQSQADIKNHIITGFGLQQTILPNLNNYEQLKNDIEDPDNFQLILKGAHDFMYKNGMTIRIKRISTKAYATHTLNFNVIQQPPKLNFVKLHPQISSMHFEGPTSPVKYLFSMVLDFNYVDERELMHNLDRFVAADVPNAFYNWLTSYLGGGWSHGAALRDAMSQDELDDLQDYIDAKGDYKTAGFDVFDLKDRLIDRGLARNHGMSLSLKFLASDDEVTKYFNPEHQEL